MRLALALALALAALPSRAAAADPPPAPPGPPRVKLAVLVVFDQLRGDMVDKWRPLFGPGGFNRLQTEGAWFKNCYYPFGTTMTGPGHAAMLTGASPDKHGIIMNEWYDAKAGEEAYCAGGTRYKPVPPLPKFPADEPKDGPKKDGPPPVKPVARPKQVGTPDRLLSETVADVLKGTYGAKSKVFGLSLKDRSAILPTGKRPDGVFWFDGRFGTSDYYADRIPDWVAAFNDPKNLDKWFGKDWTKVRPDLDYERHSGPDDAPGEGKGAGPTAGKDGFQGVTFPHPTTGGRPAVGRGYYEALANSPYGNDLLLEFTKACIEAEKLGQREAPDLLVVSFSSNDLIGHTWGPDSQEVLDVTLRSDALMADLLKYLDAKVGKGNYAVALTADHGICPLPEASRAAGRDAKRVDLAALRAAAEKHLAATYGPAAKDAPKDAPPADPAGKPKSAWVEGDAAPWYYLNPRLVAASGRPRAEVARTLADVLAKQDGVMRVFTREDLQGEFPEADVIGRRMKKAFHPDRCGDVCVVLKPYYLPSKPLGTGTTHGSPHDYDCHVPLLVLGPGVAGGAKDEPTAPQAAAAVLARMLGVRPPKDAEAPVPKTLGE